MSSPDTRSAIETVRIWDPALRVFHWALAAAVILAWGLGEFGPDVMTLHFYAGYAVIGLLAFRLIWALVGPRPARFSSFVYRPREILAYAAEAWRRKPSYWRGHNPLGGLFIVAVLLALALQALSGLVADPEDFVNVGPLAASVPAWVSRKALLVHEVMGSVILGLVALHLAAIAFYKLWKGEDLVRPMLTGLKTVRRT
ncbi:cytochrome b/b6 domain-containing protein [Rhodobacter sp. CZR27]|uniref:cytochrome b/b6 domain-containing protein n=1 Tax=Rhodobacter sp. CZR27 TaxID=2033869 RepID=UPI000BBEE613|nr:cytochrome b/b6 domain-containing protein [Rhodobacter sp. CZR27]